MGITEFLTARYDAEDAIARRHAHRFTNDQQRIWNGPGQYPVMTGLALMQDVAAKRAIVALHPVYEYHQTANPWREKKTYLHCDTCGDPQGWDQQEPVDWPCPTLLALAQPYAEHPDFDPAWRTA